MLNNNFISNSNLILKRDLPTLLCSTSESVVGSKMASSLLSRLVVLNLAAQQHLLPHLLIPRTGTIASLFTSRLKSVFAKDNVDNNSISSYRFNARVVRYLQLSFVHRSSNFTHFPSKRCANQVGPAPLLPPLRQFDGLGSSSP